MESATARAKIINDKTTAIVIQTILLVEDFFEEPDFDCSVAYGPSAGFGGALVEDGGPPPKKGVPDDGGVGVEGEGNGVSLELLKGFPSFLQITK